MREAQSAATLRSPHVVQILDYGVDDKLPFIVMELLDGENLAQRLRRLGSARFGRYGACRHAHWSGHGPAPTKRTSCIAI